ncbi:MAG: hypothetical protein KGY76_07215 [Candidatus Thermoplasmatota archaeon]|nr:hypothetical protein [Candidatus Thermoplasmatota archaeon]
MRKKGVLLWLVVILGSPLLFYFGLSSVLGHSSLLCFLSLFSGFFVLYVWLKLADKFTEPTGKWGESESEKKAQKKSSAEKYSVEERSKKKSVFSRLFKDEDECEECGTELVYKSGADAYYCPECKEYKWR